MNILNIFILVAIGLAGGVLGGMGFGGGTLLIPLLTLFAGISQHVAQSINLIAFIPMSIVAIIIHAKNKLIDYKSFFIIAIPAVVVSVIGSILAKMVNAHSLSKYFGIFLLALGVVQLVFAAKNIVKDWKNRIKKKNIKKN